MAEARSLTNPARSISPTFPKGGATLTAAKTGLVSLSYGQRRPLQPGTPLQLAKGQTLRDLHIRLPRGSAIGGQVADESGEPLAGLLVRAMRMQVTQGQRQMVPAGNGQTDDSRAYRIWGLNPGETYVSAVAPNAVFGDGFGRGAPLPGGGRGFVGRGGGQFGTVAIDAGALDTIAERAAFVGGTVMFADGSPQGTAYAPTYIRASRRRATRGPSPSASDPRRSASTSLS